MKHVCKKLWLIGSCFLLCSRLAAQVNSLGLSGHTGFIFAHSRKVQNTSGAHPFALQLEWEKQRLDTAAWDLCRCFPRQGYLLNYTDYDVALLGRGVKLAYFLEPSFNLGKKIQLGIRGAGGLSWSSHPFDSFSNPANQSYSTALNAYLSLGLNLNWLAGKHWLSVLYLQYNHISNGGLKNPNKGINWPTAGIGLRYRLQDKALPEYRNRSRAYGNGGWRLDLAPFYSSRTIAPAESKRYSIYGMQVQAAYNRGRLHGWTLAAEVSRDLAMKERMRRAGLQPLQSRLAGLALGHEFLLGRFVFAQQLGVYVSETGPFYQRLYHRWSLWYRVHARWGLGGSLKAHAQVANFFDARIVFSLRKPGK